MSGLIRRGLTATVILAILLTPDSISAKKYTRRELARGLMSLGVSKDDIAMWICIATHESGLDSDAINRCNDDSSWDHGLWQINDKYWVGRNRRGGACGFSAAEVRGDNLANAVQCVRYILDEHRRLQGDGWLAWSVYSDQRHCRGDLSSYVEGCF
ncbi:putative lysozyme C-2 [Neodiprion lecontei]|uniref:lysozyme n=1 Tax=Neodiprion lecontei TaxID=441921 RepID=A0A6J0BJA0_NEOLC|nr:putative lysozyme C-2 [Neodiprion lecontei]XP_046599771.1 putative lysozyme C-2 [Neodiprion lecontei]